MKNVSMLLLNLLANFGWMSATQAAGSASTFWYYQPKEPTELKNSGFKKEMLHN